MKVRFQADADLDGRVIRGLKRIAPEIHLRTSAEAGLAGLDDLEVPANQRGDGSYSGQSGPPDDARQLSPVHRVILLRPGISIAAAIDEIVLIWSASQTTDWTNRLVWIPL